MPKTPGRSRPGRPTRTAAPKPAKSATIALSFDCEAWEDAIQQVLAACTSAHAVKQQVADFLRERNLSELFDVERALARNSEHPSAPGDHHT